jgi:2-amino-4-hydroxy-6-hydroxymethyldihydropteridine diphosphokinase
LRFARLPDIMAPEPWRYAVGVGGNRGDSEAWQERAARLLDASGLVRVVARSPAIATAPVGGPAGQDPYLNAVWVLASGLGPHSLLHLLQTVETACGRSRSVRWGPRTLDLDLLARDDGLVVASPVLSLPHPRAHERAFVLDPWRQLVACGQWRAPLPG